MHHEIGVQWQDSTEQTRKIDFTVYGDPNGYSAMAASVGFPTGIATKMILDGEYFWHFVSNEILGQRAHVLPPS